jgi:transcriptional regulator with XRE-family HTH domain
MARTNPPALGTMGHLIETLRVRAGLSQGQLAERATEAGCKGFNQGSVSRWELNKEAPSIQQFRVIVSVARGPKKDLEAGLSLLNGLSIKVVGTPPAAMGA